MQIMKLEGLVVSKESYNNDDEYDLIYSNIDYLNALFAEYLYAEEASDDALKSYYVDYYLAQVNNGGFSQFVYNSAWSKSVVSYVQQGLREMGAAKNLALFSKSAQILNALGEQKIAEYLDGEYFGTNEERDALNSFDDEFYLLQDDENLAALNAQWIRQHPGLEVLDDKELQARLASVAEAIPNRTERIQGALDAEPRYTKIIRALSDAAGHQLDRVTAGDPSNEYEGEKILAWHFLTDQGHFYFIEHKGHAIMFHGESHEVIASLPAGEEYGE